MNVNLYFLYTPILTFIFLRRNITLYNINVALIANLHIGIIQNIFAYHEEYVRKTLCQLLFNNVLQMVFQMLDFTNNGLKINEKFLSNLHFADDIILFANSASELQYYVKWTSPTNYAGENKVKIC